jgi:predicted TIM-barrel enzyme
MSTENGRYQQIPTIEAAPLEDGMILLDPDTNQFSVLNQTASAIWSRVAQPATSDEIVAEIRAGFDEVGGAVASEVEETLRQMIERRLIKQV